MNCSSAIRLLLVAALFVTLGCGAENTATQAETRPASQSGHLLIVGGALRSDNQAVYQAFIDAIPAAYPNVAIVPAASGRPAHYAQQFTDDLRAFGFTGEVRVLPIAVKDDPSTESVDESQWRNGGSDEALAESLQDVGGIWFVGGDQTRTTDTLLDQEGTDTPVLAAIRTQLSRGAVIGGTSAGAAIMSHSMIAAGDSLSALTLPATDEYVGMESQESGQLLLSRGLGFLPVGIVDQHFDRKARLGRLVRALGHSAEPIGRIGFGVDEDTALLVNLDGKFMQVLGAGNLVVADARNAHFSDDSEAEGAFAVRGVELSVLSAGDRLHWSDGKVVAGGSQTTGSEAFGYRATQGGGFALANPRLDQLLGFSLLDNSEMRELRRYSFDEQTGRGVLYRFRQTDESLGYWRYGSGTKDQYSLVGVVMDIEPVSVAITSAR
ncbi:cyanophycinase [Microbulbifer salipaludis]|uniref:Cyanophycinase n=1 Tax=Microbulbifer salipaludis TaxID=187980 RepID=A0ABS3E7C7_9GAMM|nr:cyanophycinase [Microbulbifer salipaludis]